VEKNEDKHRERSRKKVEITERVGRIKANE